MADPEEAPVEETTTEEEAPAEEDAPVEEPEAEEPATEEEAPEEEPAAEEEVEEETEEEAEVPEEPAEPEEPPLIPDEDFNWVEYLTAVYSWAANMIGWKVYGEPDRISNDDPYELYEPTSGYGYIKKLKAIKGAVFLRDYQYDLYHSMYLLLMCTVLDFGFDQCTENVWADLYLNGGHPDGILKYFNLFRWEDWGELFLWTFIIEWWSGIWGNLASGFISGMYFLY
jgi:hypothetical protein